MMVSLKLFFHRCLFHGLIYHVAVLSLQFLIVRQGHFLFFLIPLLQLYYLVLALGPCSNLLVRQLIDLALLLL